MKKVWAGIILLFTTIVSCYAQDAVSTANRLIHSLSKEQQSTTLFPFLTEERFNFHFVPKERKGITINELNEVQKTAVVDLLRACLSEKTFQQTQDIRRLDAILKVLEKRNEDDHYRDTGNYHLSIFGIPANNTIWGWRFEGHHISFSFSFNQQKMVSGTPGFLGSNPSIVLEGKEKGKQVLKDETDMALALLHSLNAQQMQQVLLSKEAPRDIISFNKRTATTENIIGISYASLTTQQQQFFLQLVSVYVHRFTKLFAEDMLKQIQEAGLENLRFAWAGKTDAGPGNPHYYSIKGPTILIEYDNTQNNANHVHSVIRDLKYDFGGDALLEHYQKQHAH